MRMPPIRSAPAPPPAASTRLCARCHHVPGMGTDRDSKFQHGVLIQVLIQVLINCDAPSSPFFFKKIIMHGPPAGRACRACKHPISRLQASIVQFGTQLGERRGRSQFRRLAKKHQKNSASRLPPPASRALSPVEFLINCFGFVFNRTALTVALSSQAAGVSAGTHRHAVGNVGQRHGRPQP